ncbi:hypothetical protein [Streptomyces sp. NRRL S-87]|uniref:hypothetical protein n=1 Tax=Streptomyces sp. NRRL S-87 TaxID=1463920 RepID=UPI000559F380|nr:hypothetical protein [Streptomyces sp. NRRL S-87]
MTLRRPSALAALLVGVGVGVGAALGVAGCSPSGGAPASARSAPPPAPFGGVTAAESGRAAVALHAENERLVAACMRGRGLTYRPQPSRPGADRPEPNPYGLLTPAGAAADGYGVTGAALAAGPPADANGDRAADRRWQDALLGTEAQERRLPMPDGSEFFYRADSCAVRADLAQYGPEYLRLSNTFVVLGNRVVDAVERDPRFVRARARWSSCMTAAGHPSTALTDPVTAIGRELDAAGTDPAAVHAVAGRELDVARTDAGCQARAGLADAVAAAQSDAEGRVGGAYVRDLATLRAVRARARATALAAAGARA